MKTMLKTILIIVILSVSVAGCDSGNATISTSELMPAESQLPSSEDNDQSTAEPRYYYGTDIIVPEDQEVNIYPQYYGTWVVGAMVGSGYGYPDIDPDVSVMGSKLVIEKDKVTFDGPKGVEILENPRYITVLETAYYFSSRIISNYDSFGFPNDFLIRIEIYDGNELWKPVRQFWIKDRDTLIAVQSVFHELKRE